MRPTGFYVGLYKAGDSQHFPRVCISISRLRGRRKVVECAEVLVDSGAFMELKIFGRYRHDVAQYASELYRLHTAGVVKIAAAVAQDYMCEPFMTEKTGLSVDDHQRLTVERYDDLLAALASLFGGPPPFPVMPVLQGYHPESYVRHLAMYGDRLKPGMWVGVGSVCKRNGAPERIVEVLAPIKALRPDLELHGFGVKSTALAHPGVRALLSTSDSMAWSLAARWEGRDGNHWGEAKIFADRMEAVIARADAPWQLPMLI